MLRTFLVFTGLNPAPVILCIFVGSPAAARFIETSRASDKKSNNRKKVAAFALFDRIYKYLSACFQYGYSSVITLSRKQGVYPFCVAHRTAVLIFSP